MLICLLKHVLNIFIVLYLNSFHMLIYLREIITYTLMADVKYIINKKKILVLQPNYSMLFFYINRLLT